MRRYCRRRCFRDINIICTVQRQRHGSICLNVLRLTPPYELLLSKLEGIFSNLKMGSLAWALFHGEALQVFELASHVTYTSSMRNRLKVRTIVGNGGRVRWVRKKDSQGRRSRLF